jgi:signal transduction histidine kinase
MALLVVLGTALPLLVNYSHLNEQLGSLYVKTFSGHVALLRSVLEPIPEERWQEKLGQMRSQYSYPVDIFPGPKSGLPSDVLEALPRRGLVAHVQSRASLSWSRFPDRLRLNPFTCTIYASMKQGRYILVLGPLPELPGPRTSSILLVGATLALVLVLTSIVVGLPLVRRLRRLEGATDALREGNLGVRVNDTGPDIIGTLARSFDRTANELQRQIDGQRHLIQAVSHELRTPVANITFALDMLEENREPEKFSGQVRFVQNEIKQVSGLIQELLDFARMDAGTAPLDLQPTPILPLLDLMIERIMPGRPEIRFQTEGITQQQVVLVDARLFRRALENLMRNARVYARTTVLLRVEDSESELTIDVEDDGPGIAQENRERVFDPFFRLDGSRSKDSGGVGLGLAITRRILELHGGQVWAGVSSLGGARFRTVWPGPPR